MRRTYSHCKQAQASEDRVPRVPSCIDIMGHYINLLRMLSCGMAVKEEVNDVSAHKISKASQIPPSKFMRELFQKHHGMGVGNYTSLMP